MCSNLADSSEIVMSFLDSKTCETDWGLTSFVMLLGQFNCEFCDNIPSISLEGCIESSITVNNNEAKRRFIEEKFFLQIIKLEFGLAAVNRKINGFEGFELNNEFLFSSWVLIHDPSCKYDETIFRGLIEIF